MQKKNDEKIQWSSQLATTQRHKAQKDLKSNFCAHTVNGAFELKCFAVSDDSCYFNAFIALILNSMRQCGSVLCTLM